VTSRFFEGAGTSPSVLARAKTPLIEAVAMTAPMLTIRKLCPSPASAERSTASSPSTATGARALGILGLRVRAVAGAQRATLDQAEGAAPALRASLVDLAAVAEAVAADLPASPARG